VLVFGSAFMSSMNLETVALPSLQHVRDKTGDSSSMAVLSRHEILYVAHVSTNRQLRLTANVGTRFPIYATSLGKILLAFQSEEAIEDYLRTATLTRLTERTITDPGVLRGVLAEARANGHAAALDELDYGIVSVAVPVFDRDRRITCAINCSTTTSRIAQADLIATRLPLLQQAAREIQQALLKRPFLAHSLTGSVFFEYRT